MHYSTLEMDTFKVMLLRSIKNLAHKFKSPFLDIEINKKAAYRLWKYIVRPYIQHFFEKSKLGDVCRTHKPQNSSA